MLAVAATNSKRHAAPDVTRGWRLDRDVHRFKSPLSTSTGERERERESFIRKHLSPSRIQGYLSFANSRVRCCTGQYCKEVYGKGDGRKGEKLAKLASCGCRCRPCLQRLANSMHVLRRSNDAESADSTTAGPSERTEPPPFQQFHCEHSEVA